MSANNQLVIKKIKQRWYVDEFDVGCGIGSPINDFDTLEEAIKYANKYLEENEVEYNYTIKLARSNET